MSTANFSKKAELAYQTGQYEKATEFISNFINAENKLSVEERELFANSYQARIEKHREMRKKLLQISDKSAGDQKKHADDLKNEVENEIKSMIEEAFKLIGTLIKSSNLGGAEKAFYLRMKANYIKYLIEIISNATERKKKVEECRKIFEEGIELANSKMEPSDPLRLSLYLNYGKFCEEQKQIIGEKELIKVAKMVDEAFEASLRELNKLSDEKFIKSAIVMQLMKEKY